MIIFQVSIQEDLVINGPALKIKIEHSLYLDKETKEKIKKELSSLLYSKIDEIEEPKDTIKE